ncbi:VCBS domain-containing protein [Cyanobium sp. L1E-Cus]|uniref:VCBS domain-containing protein n=1 Tax=Cyanobium sp. L1E-Cus TaxID=2823714 RepID=UPI0028F42C0A|nr:VCBS domain-containing protein [Cyanobium sp. L1E-Cus]MCP9823492.1 VCBS domain-containing protein [Cyanobium sp. L1E-Cus]
MAPSPTVALGPSSLDLLYGNSGNLQLTFDESSGTGFQPWLELQVAAPSNHLSFGAASWALLPIATKTYTFTRSGTSGPYTLVHPLTGATLTSATPDTLLIWQLPVGSYVASAPALVVSVPVSVKATSPTLGPVPLRAGGGYALGTDPLNNPLTDPPISAPNVTGQVVPSPLTFSKSNNLAESETATGPNFIGAWRLSADIADGAQLNKLVVSDTLPNDLNLLEINPSLKLNGKLTQQPVGNPTAPSNNQVVIDYGGPTTGTTSTEEAAAQIRFFVPDTLDPTTGGAITYANNASVSATWGNSPDGSVKLNTPANNEIIAKALAIQKSASSGSVLPGGDLTFTLNFQISDYFAFGDLIVKDLLGDGLTYTPGSARINLQEQGVSLTGNGSAAFDPAYITYLPDVAGPGVDGKDSLSFNLSGWLKSIGNDGILQGGRVFSTTAGATRGSITFTASVDDLYVAPKAAGQNIKPGDQLANNVTLQGDIQKQLPLGLFLDTNRQVSDTSGVAMSVADIGNAKTVVARNGQALGSAPLVLTPGDTVTYRIKVTFPIGDIHGFNLSDFLPTPVYNVDGEASGGASPTGFELFGSGATASSPGSLPPTGRFSYGSLHTAPPLVDNLLKSGPAVNDLVATIANTSDPTHTPVTVDLYYTVTVTGAAIDDRLPITNIATATTVDSNGTSRPPQIAAVTGEVLAPNLKIRKGIVVTSRDSLSGAQGVTYSPTLNTGGATFPASIGSVPFSGAVSSSGISVAGGNGSTGAVKSNALDSNVTGLDAGDTVRFVMVIENIGTSYRGAFNVQLRDELPAGLTFTPGSLRIVDGSGALMGYTKPDGTAASQADIFSATGVRLSDPGPTAADPLTGAGGGAIDGYNSSSGRNIAVVTFDTSINQDAYSQLVGSKLTNVGVLEDYTNVSAGGTGYLPGSTKLIDNATITLRNATVSKSVVSTSEASTSGSNVAIGEIVRYRLQVTVPEGNLANFKLVDSLPTGVSFLGDGSASTPIFSSGVSGSLRPATPTINGSTLTWDFGTLTNSDRNNAVDDSIAIEFNALVTNISGNSNGTTRTNTATVSYAGGSASGSTAVTITEPNITITKAVSPTSNVQAGDTLIYTVTVKNAAGRADAFDLVLNDALGNLGSNFDLQSVTLPGTLPSGTSSIVDNSVTNGTSAADGDRIQLKIDRLSGGQSFSFTYKGVLLTGIQPGTTLTNTANITYTGLPGTGTPNGTGGNTTGSSIPGGSGAENGERNGSGGVNTYSKNASQSVVSQDLGPIKSTRLTSEAHTSGNGVAIGEIVRFRLQTSIPQGTIGNTSFVDNLPTGLTFLNDNTASLAFVSTNPADLTWSLGPITPYYLPSAGNNNTVIPTARFAPTVTGQALTWSLGQIVNLNAVDAQIESVIVEFNAIVANVASNQAGVTLTNSFIAKSSLSGITSQVTSSAPPLSVLEPKLETDKTVAIEKTGVAGNANATPGDTLVYTVVVRNTGTVKAFNLFIDDNLDALGLNFDLSGSPTIVQSQTGAPAPTDNSIFSGSNGLADRISVLIPELDINQSVTLTYLGVLSAGLPPGTALTNTAQVTYTSLPGTGTPTGSGGNSTGSSTPGGSGAANGERNGDGGVNDYLSSKTLILVANRPPVAVNDTGNAVEAGGTSNTTPGSNATGSLLTNDNDPDPADNPLTSKGKVTSFRTGSTEGSGTAGSLGAPLLGTYGQLTVNADGTYTYVVDNRNALVDALDPGASLSESFNYTVSDGALSDIGVISITIQGANDAPVAANDTGTVVKAGGTPGATATGNVISNDRDIDNRDGNNLVAPPEGTVVAVRTGAKEGAGTAGTVGAALKGIYGSLTLSANGTYTYVVDNTNPMVDALNPGDTLSESFNYTLLDHRDGLNDIAVLTITIQGRNDAPVALNDAGSALEAGGTSNGTPGANAIGNVLTNDTDVDSNDTPALNGFVESFRTGATEGSGTAGTIGAPLQGLYGSITFQANGTYIYVVNNTNPAVDPLDPGAFLSESFNYTVSDGALTDIGILTITITGANDAPVAADDFGNAIEAGGARNGTPGSNAVGNVIINDRDVDTADGNNLTGPPQGRITAVRTGDKEDSGTSGVVGTALQGLYGALTLKADGSYVYVVDNSLLDVDSLDAGSTLRDLFNYSLLDHPGGLIDTAVLTIIITGANDAPVAINDTGTALEAGGTFNGTAGSNATGNVLLNDTDVDAGDTPALNGSVSAIRTGAGEGSGTAGTVGTGLAGLYGTLTINANGSYIYVVDNSNPAVDALDPGATLIESFNYTVRDRPGGLSDIGVLTITITGVNDAPIANNDTGIAVEAGGTSNTDGSNATGNVISNDRDVDTADGANFVAPPLASVLSIRSGDKEGLGNAGSLGAALAGAYGSLTLNANGIYTYEVDNANSTVDALNPGDVLTETFNYTLQDHPGGLTDIAVLTININGVNDAPVASDDAGTAIEAGGISNSLGGADGTGNVLLNDTDVDSNDTPAINGTIVGIRRGATTDGSGTAGTPDGSGGFVLVGSFGTLTIAANGIYTYVVDNANPSVDALNPGDVLTESFNYSVLDHPGGLTDIAILTITIEGAQDGNATANTLIAGEAGGVNNSSGGFAGRGDLLDPSLPAGTSVIAIRTGDTPGSGTAGSVDAAGNLVLTGIYGTLTVNPNGDSIYRINNSNPVVDALDPGDTLSEFFNYDFSDGVGTSTAVLTVNIGGSNDTPVANNDSGTAVEAGGTQNGTAGSDAGGNVISNDRDVDNNDGANSAAPPLATITAIRRGAKEGEGLTGTAIAGDLFQLVGFYGTLTIAAKGSYSYVLNNSNPIVDELDAGDFIIESFNYTVLDHPSGLTDTAVLNIRINGVNDAPVASDDSGAALEAGGVANGTAGSNATGNVLSNDTDVDRDDTPTLNGAVSAIRIGATEGSGTAGTADGFGGFVLTGSYGILTIAANGSYTYVVNNSNPTVDALSPGQTLSDEFNYTVRDRGGLTDIARLTIRIDGANDAPIAANDTGSAVEAGGTLNGTAGTNASGNVISNDRDVDNNDGGNSVAPPLATITAIRRGAKEGVGLDGAAIAGGAFELVGFYGTLTIAADGSYTYVVNNSNRFVEALDAGDFIIESFNYTVLDHPSGLTDTAVLNIRINGVNDAPVASNDSSSALEAGGVANGTAGSNATGNVLNNDTDVDRDDTPALNGVVTAIRTGASEGAGTAGTPDGAGAFVVRGAYGTLTINANGTYTYVVDNSNPLVDALSPGDSLQEEFNYTVRDLGGLTDIGVLRITIDGANDAPIARNDTGTALEAGGTNNGTPGTNSSGNVLTNDSDVDRNDTPLPTKGSVSGIRTGIKEGTGVAGVPDGSGGFVLVGTYGTLRINANGSYTYTVDNGNPAVDGMDAGDQFTETFNYTVLDTGGLSDIALLTITIKGANDAPVAGNDTSSAIEAGGTLNGTPGADAIGNVLTNDTDVDRSDTPSLNGAVTAIRLGDAEGLGTAGVVGSPLQGLYGSLTIDNNGNYRYLIDNANPTVEALNPGDLLSESFNYTVSDGGGLTDTAVLTITIRGSNDAPVASDDSGIAKEAGGINNSSGGANASGNVLANDTDVDSNDTPLPSKGTVTAIRTGAVEGAGTAGSVGSAIQGQYGSLLINANGSFTYVVNNSDLTVERLNVGEQLTEFFNYTVLDHSGGLTDIAVLAVTVEGTNDSPNTSDDYIGRFTSGQSGTIRVIANDTDIDSRLVPSTIKIEGTANPGEPLVVPGQGTWSVDPGNGDITFTPETGVTASPTPIKYTVQDEQGATSNPATVYINYDSPSVGPEPPIPVTEARPVNLFLLLDNSTSMQGLDPTGVTRLEAQNRLAFYYGLKPVFNNAGYIFKKGDQIGFNGDVQLTPGQSLATEILSWELIDNPFDNKTAQTVTIHTIDFSYLVTHTKTVINSSSTAEGVTLASDVLATTTPDKQYGNSTSGDWIARGLPAPGNLDAYTAPGTPGNRYSGTEMLGALTGLKDLLNDELTSVATDTLTYVGLFTDGRPERRPWWDNRPEFGQGWSGVNVALPTDADLGGDPIISSGLRYLSNGTPIKVPTANGVDIWGQNQRELNAALDRTAAASGSPDNVKVISVGLGDGGISNWSAIYSDLFTNQTFNNQAGGWGYQVVTPNIQLQS